MLSEENENLKAFQRKKTKPLHGEVELPHKDIGFVERWLILFFCANGIFSIFFPLIWLVCKNATFYSFHMNEFYDATISILLPFVAVSLVFFLYWFYKLNLNKFYVGDISLTESTQYVGPLASVFWIFIPGANIFFSSLALNEVYDIMHSKAFGVFTLQKRFVFVFWIFFIISIYFGRAIEYDSTFAYLFYVGITCTASFLGAYVIFHLSNAQIFCIAQKRGIKAKFLKFGMFEKVSIIFLSALLLFAPYYIYINGEIFSFSDFPKKEILLKKYNSDIVEEILIFKKALSNELRQ